MSDPSMFDTPEWQEKIKRSLEELDSGEFETFDTTDEFFAALGDTRLEGAGRMTDAEVIEVARDYVKKWEAWIERDVPDETGPMPIIAAECLKELADRLEAN